GAAPAATETREFPAGSYIIRMDQPYARIADALLDHQYWSPNDPQKTPYDDTGWSFPENFAVQTVRVTDVKVLDVPMTRVTDVNPVGGVSGAGAVAMINHNGDNALATLRYRFKDADMQAAEEPFESNGQKFNRGSFIIRGVAQADLDKATKELGLKAYSGAAPSVKTHPIRAARVALMHTWISTQTEGWWRLGFDNVGVPYDYISTQDLARTPDLKSKYDVIVFGPAGGTPEQIVEGMPMWRNPMPWKVTPETPNITTFAQTDDIRPGMGLTGLANLRSFVERGGVLITCDNTADFAVQFGFARGVSQNQPPRLHVVGSLLRTKLVDETSPIVYGIIDNLSVFSKTGESFNISNTLGGRGGGRGGAGGGARATGRGLPDDPDFVTGFPALDPKNQAAVLPSVQPWQASPILDDQLRNPLNIIPPEQRPRVPLRFSEQGDLLQSGLLDGTDVAQHPVVVDAPYEKGHVVLFANNPIYRGMTIGSYFLVFNTILNFDNLNAGRKLDAR
ncbi:MAG: peptidase carboxypeptidase, partial [Gemmatimonadetes bacterium]|nr:peptidase carboxypeptidase [Gemmatimonadota bacterium]